MLQNKVFTPFKFGASRFTLDSSRRWLNLTANLSWLKPLKTGDTLDKEDDHEIWRWPSLKISGSASAWPSSGTARPRGTLSTVWLQSRPTCTRSHWLFWLEPVPGWLYSASVTANSHWRVPAYRWLSQPALCALDRCRFGRFDRAPARRVELGDHFKVYPLSPDVFRSGSRDRAGLDRHPCAPSAC